MSSKPDLDSAMRDGAVQPLDDRGLMPLEEARRHLASVTAFAKGEGSMVGGTFVLESDRTWASLVSLAAADEFVKEARRLRWEFHPRGHFNVALHERYGDGILPWLIDHIDASGNLTNVPWCVMPCLEAIGTPAGFAAMWRVCTLDGDPRSQMAANAFFERWLARHPAVGYPEVARLAQKGDEGARYLLRLTGGRAPKHVFGMVSVALGEEPTREIFAALGIAPTLAPVGILSLFDEEAAKHNWPVFNRHVDGRAEYYALRLVAGRAKEGDAWGVAFERITGTNPYEWSIERSLYGSGIKPGIDLGESPQLPVEFFGDDEATGTLDGISLRGPAGTVEISTEIAEERDLRPGRGTEPYGGGNTTVALRFYLDTHPGTLWPDAHETLGLLGLGEEPDLIAVTSAFEHFGGEVQNADLRNAFTRKPSESTALRTLAQAIAERDASLFVPGPDNTRWRLHVLYDDRAGAEAQAQAPDTSAWPAATAALEAFDGEWYSEDYRFALRIRGTEGRTTISNSEHTPVGDVGLRLLRTLGLEVAGELEFTDGTFYPIDAQRTDARTLRVTAPTFGLTWNMTLREES